MSAVRRADELMAFADGVEQAGWADYAHKARATARDVHDLASQLEAERSARQALQARCEQLQQIVATAAYASTTDPAFDDIPWPDAQ